MKHHSLLLAAGTLAIASAAFAQGNPPTTAPANPATAAGQQSPAGGPMGTTGTTPQNNTAGGTAPAAPSMNTGSSNDTSLAASNTTRPMRPARADRN
jgi:hypothetical protein